METALVWLLVLRGPTVAPVVTPGYFEDREACVEAGVSATGSFSGMVLFDEYKCVAVVNTREAVEEKYGH